jgi:hypothetical protein
MRGFKGSLCEHLKEIKGVDVGDSFELTFEAEVQNESFRDRVYPIREGFTLWGEEIQRKAKLSSEFFRRKGREGIHKAKYWPCVGPLLFMLGPFSFYTFRYKMKGVPR